ncbi:unnamed protein product [Clonostachys rosea f. rosea IK726]|uniref:Uncharacterized protein n=1 Tax=Clonostachys rosea f. rosea IK726 TaxID=1349383 RepID=A0ACA9T9K4_BIOOC|nr:unnamed protein product [Clonostachys rosea f. rosea IK726]
MDDYKFLPATDGFGDRPGLFLIRYELPDLRHTLFKMLFHEQGSAIHPSGTDWWKTPSYILKRTYGTWALFKL